MKRSVPGTGESTPADHMTMTNMRRRPWAGLKAGLAGSMALGMALAGCSNTRLLPTIPPGERIDSFIQQGHGKVDVLWVVDDSPSMADKQTNLANNFAQFFDVLQSQGIDYHIGVITTDVTHNGGVLVGNPKVITTSTANPIAAFESNVKLPDNGNPLDEGLDAVRLFFEAPDPTFLRTDAFLFVIIISDKDDVSLPGDSHFFYRLFSGLKGVGNNNMVNVSAIVGDTCDGGTCQANGCFNPVGMWEAQAAPRYTAVAQALNGLVSSVCDASFASDLQALGISAVGLQRTFPLTDVPDPTTLQVTVNVPCSTMANNGYISSECTMEMQCGGNPPVQGCMAKQANPDGGMADGWVYEPTPNAIVFQGSSVPPKGSTIQILYKSKDSTVQR